MQAHRHTSSKFSACSGFMVKPAGPRDMVVWLNQKADRMGYSKPQLLSAELHRHSQVRRNNEEVVDLEVGRCMEGLWVE